MTETRASETIGFIGLGNMGLPMCLNLVDAGYDVVALDLRPEPVAEVVAAGGRTADDVAAVAAEADILLTSLPRRGAGRFPFAMQELPQAALSRHNQPRWVIAPS